MRIGKTLLPGKENPHLKAEYVEVFPDSNMRDITLIAEIPAKEKAISEELRRTGQTPILVRRTFIEQHPAAFIDSTIPD